MTELLLEWVFTSIFLILVVLALRAALGKRMSAGLRYALWGVVLVRLLVPVQLFRSPLAGTWVTTEKRMEQNASAPAEPPAVSFYVEDDAAQAVDSQNGTAVGFGGVPSAPGAPTFPDAPEPPAAPDLTKAPAWLGWTWLAGTAAVAAVLLLSNLRFAWKLRRERIALDEADLPVRVYMAVDLPSPCLFGVLRPAVYITPEAAMDPDMLRHVLAHEYTHYRHGDHIWSLLRCAALAAHWWNPLVWIAARLSQRDGELACDEGAIKRLGDGERMSYGNTLLTLVTAKPRPGDLFRCATTMAGDKKSLKERISRIACAPRRIIWVVVVAVTVTALACLCAFGQAEPEDEPDGWVRPEHFARLVGVENLPEVVYTSASGFAEDHFKALCLQIKDRDWGRGSPAQFDDWRVSALEGPLEGPLDGSGYQVWEARYEFHTTTPEEARVLLAGGMTLSEDGWLALDNVFYLLFREDEAGALSCYVEVELGAGLDPEDNPEEFWARIKACLPMDEDNILGHFGVDNLGHVPEVVLQRVGEIVLERYDALRDYLEITPLSDVPIRFDNWRVEALNGPWHGSALGMDLEVWQINYEFHTTTPEAAMNLVNGGAYLTEDGWLCPVYPRCTYVVFRVNEGGKPEFLLHFTDNGVSPDGNTDAYFERLGDLLVQRRLADPNSFASIDLNRNGVPETLNAADLDENRGQRVEVWENGRLLYEEEGYFAHAGYNALFLYRDEDGKDYLLRYNPVMYQGMAEYSYQLFTLETPSEYSLVKANFVKFDLNFGSPIHEDFDPEAIADFMDDVNRLLSGSVQLLNTDSELLQSFDRNGRLADTLAWLDLYDSELFTSRDRWSLRDCLREVKRIEEERTYAEEPLLFPMGEKDRGIEVQLSYQDKRTRFEADWAYNYQPAEDVKIQVVDLNGDGKDEIVFPLIWGHGTGAYNENLYVFDAETLEQYDTSGLCDMILGSIQSTGDEDNFYLSGPGMDQVVIPKSKAREVNPDAPMANRLGFADIIQYTIRRSGERNGEVICLLGCDASIAGINYIGFVYVPVRMSPSGTFSCGSAWYAPSQPPT